MANVLVKATDPGATSIVIDGVTYTRDASGNFAVPEGSLHRALDLGRFKTPTSLTAAQINALRVANQTDAGFAVFNADLGAPIWRNKDGNGWVDGAGDPSYLSINPTIESYSPLAAATGVSVAVQPVINFSALMDESTINSETVVLIEEPAGASSVVPCSIACTIVGGKTRVTLTPDAPLDADTHYAISTVGIDGSTSCLRDLLETPVLLSADQAQWATAS